MEIRKQHQKQDWNYKSTKILYRCQCYLSFYCWKLCVNKSLWLEATKTIFFIAKGKSSRNEDVVQCCSNIYCDLNILASMRSGLKAKCEERTRTTIAVELSTTFICFFFVPMLQLSRSPGSQHSAQISSTSTRGVDYRQDPMGSQQWDPTGIPSGIPHSTGIPIIQIIHIYRASIIQCPQL